MSASADARGAAARRSAERLAGLGFASALLCLSSLVWIGQAAMLAVGVGAISEGGGVSDLTIPAAIVLGLGILRAALDAAGGRLAFRAARRELTAHRSAATAALALRSPLDSARPASGLAASMLGEQAEAIVPYFSDFVPHA